MNQIFWNALRYGAALIALMPGTAFAVTSPGKNLTTIETVVVTAERRSQNVQDVPIAMTAISGEDLDKQGIKGFQDLAFHTPTLRFSPSTEGGENSVSLRGISNVNVTSSGDSPVGYLVDGVYMGRTTSVDPEFFDVNRIEILRGPQGTLYGRNSVGGSVNIITNQPTDELSGHVDAMIGDYNARTFRAWANVPLLDHGDMKILARVVGVSANHDGYQKNLSQAPTATNNADGENYQMLRGSILFQFSPDVDLTLAGSTSTNKDPVAFKIEQQWQPGDTYTLNGAIPNPTDPRKVYKDYPETIDQKNDSLSATLNWNLGAVKFASITGWGSQRWRQTADDDGSNLNLSNQTHWGVNQKQFSEEVHLASNDDNSPLKWIAGLFYFHEKIRQEFEVQNLPPIPFPFNYTYTSSGNVKVESYAAFGQVDYDLAKTSAAIPLTITGGLRYTHDSKRGLNHATILLYGINSITPWKGNWGRLTGRVAVSYKITPDFMIYATAANGYLSGGNLGTTYQPETAKTFEAGFKSQWFDNRLQFNTSGFYTKLKNQQVFVLTPLTTTIENAAQSTIKGVEVELVAVPLDALRLDAQLSLMSAKYDKYLTFDNRFSPVIPADFSGHRLVQTPKWTLGLGAEYTFDTSIGTITPRVDTFLSGDLYFISDNAPQDHQKAYTRTNLHVTWTEPQGRWNIEGFVSNIENKDVISQDGIQSSAVPLGGQAYDALIYYSPRTIGVRVGVNF
jgi:iron complex outermembrane receptor protein